MVLGVGAVLGPHDAGHREINVGSAILPLIALPLCPGVSVEVGVQVLEDMQGDLVSQGLTVARGDVGIGAIVPHAGQNVTGNDVLLEVFEVFAEIHDGANSLWHKQNSVGMFSRG